MGVCRLAGRYVSTLLKLQKSALSVACPNTHYYLLFLSARKNGPVTSVFVSAIHFLRVCLSYSVCALAVLEPHIQRLCLFTVSDIESATVNLLC